MQMRMRWPGPWHIPAGTRYTAMIEWDETRRRTALDAALAYARHGWPVLPCVPGGKRPLTPHGVYDATTDEAPIDGWWRRWPLANVAIATGEPGPNILDIDCKNGARGLELYDRLADEGLLAGAGAIVRTPSGGLHLYYQGTPDHGGAVHERAIELKATGGYVLAPPSSVVYDDGSRGEYRILDARPETGTIDWEAIKVELAPPRRRTRRRRGTPIEGLEQWLANRIEGERNRALYWAARRLVDAGQEPNELRNAALSTGLEVSEVERTIRSAASASTRQ